MTDDRRARDRRARLIIYSVLILVVAIGLLCPGLVRGQVATEAQEAYSLVALVRSGANVLVVADYSGSDGERQLAAILRQVLARPARAVVVSTSPQTAVSAERQLRSVVAGLRLRYGEAALHLGARDGGIDYVLKAAANVILAGQGRDHAGEDLLQQPICSGFRSLYDAAMLVVVTDGGTVAPLEVSGLGWSYGVLTLLASSSDAVTAGQVQVREGRIDAALPAGRATADYEAMVAGGGTATRYYGAVTLGTLFIIAIIIWAYLGGLLSRRRESNVGGGQQ